MLEYWKLPQILKEQQKPFEDNLRKKMQSKIDYIKFCYSKDITDRQRKLLQTDTELITAIEDYMAILHKSIGLLVAENQKLNLQIGEETSLRQNTEGLLYALKQSQLNTDEQTKRPTEGV